MRVDADIITKFTIGEGKGGEPVDKPLAPPFHGTRCALDSDASSYSRFSHDVTKIQTKKLSILLSF